MSPSPPRKAAPITPELSHLADIAGLHAEAVNRAFAIGDLRAHAAWRARQAGATLGEIAAVLGVPRPNVPPLVTRGRQLAELDAAAEEPEPEVEPAPLPELEAPAGRPQGAPAAVQGASLPSGASAPSPPRAVPAAPAPSVVPEPTVEPTPAPCLREGCPLPATPGRRFCATHLWS